MGRASAVAWAGGLAGVIALAGLALFPFPRPSPELAALAVAALWLESLPVPMPAGGILSLAPAVYLAVAHSQGLAACSFLVLAGTGLRTLLTRRTVEGASDALSVLAAAATLEGLVRWTALAPWIRLLAALEVFLPLALWLPGRLKRAGPAERKARAQVMPVRVGLCFMGGTLAVAAPLGVGPLLLAAPVLWALGALARSSVREVALEEAAGLAPELERSQQLLEQSRADRERVVSQLDRKIDEESLLEDLAVALAATNDLPGTLQAMLRVAGRVTSCQSRVVFLVEDGQLVPAAYESPHAARLADWRLLNFRDGLVEDCHRLGLLRTSPGPAPRAFEQEQQAAAFPLGGMGVLYVGDSRPRELPEGEIRMLSLLAQLSAVALRSAQSFERQVEALRLHEQAHARLDQWVTRLGYLLEGFRATASTLDPEQLLERLQVQVAQLVPHRGLYLRVEHEGLTLERRQGLSAPPRELARAVTENLKPILIEDMTTTRFPPLGHLCALAVPLMGESQAVGALVVASDEGFTREQQDLLQVLAFQAAVALRNAGLHRRIVESQAQLFHSGKLAAVGQLAAGVAHEINTPLGAVLLAIESSLGQLEKRPEVARSRLERAGAAVGRAKSIIEKLLTYSRDSGAGKSAVDLNRVVQDTVDLLEAQLRTDKVALELEPGALPPVQGNANQLHQVVSNLVLNARDAALSEGSHGRLVRVVTRAGADRVEVRVEDPGPGISKEVQARIFEPFFTTKPVGQGTGLGLSISREIVAQHGGTLSVESQPGRTLFRMILPLHGEAL